MCSLFPALIQFVNIKKVTLFMPLSTISIFLSIYVFACRVVQYLILLGLDMSRMVTVMHPVLLLSQLLFTACGAWLSTIFLSIRYNKTTTGASYFKKFYLTWNCVLQYLIDILSGLSSASQTSYSSWKSAGSITFCSSCWWECADHSEDCRCCSEGLWCLCCFSGAQNRLLWLVQAAW